jgi:hypothetical protein
VLPSSQPVEVTVDRLALAHEELGIARDVVHTVEIDRGQARADGRDADRPLRTARGEQQRRSAGHHDACSYPMRP